MARPGHPSRDGVAVTGAGTDPALIAAAEAALAARPTRRTVLVEHAGRRYIAKRLAERPRRLTQTLFMRWLVKRITGQPLPLRTLALSEAAYSMDFEARRIAALAAAGARVPRLAHRSDGYLLLEHCGTVAAEHLERWTPEEWRTMLPRLAAELGAFHRAGLWHGGAQLKNITLEDGVSTRIDFEENFGEFLPLPVVQTTDLALFLNSVSLAGPIDEAESRRLLPALLAAYFAAHSPEGGNAVRAVLARALPWLRRLSRLARPFRRFSRKGIRRVAILVDVFAGLDTPARPGPPPAA